MKTTIISYINTICRTINFCVVKNVIIFLCTNRMVEIPFCSFFSAISDRSKVLKNCKYRKNFALLYETAHYYSNAWCVRHKHVHGSGIGNDISTRNGTTAYGRVDGYLQPTNKTARPTREAIRYRLCAALNATSWRTIIFRRKMRRFAAARIRRYCRTD